MSKKKHKRKFRKKHHHSGSVAVPETPQKLGKKWLFVVTGGLVCIAIVGIIAIFKNIFVALEVMLFTMLTAIMGYLSYFIILQLVEDVQIFRKGERFDGLCTGWRMSGKTHVLQVSWTQQDMQHFKEFDALRKWRKFPSAFFTVIVLSNTIFYGGTVISLLLI